jgi:hypothetical protein
MRAEKNFQKNEVDDNADFLSVEDDNEVVFEVD